MIGSYWVDKSYPNKLVRVVAIIGRKKVRAIRYVVVSTPHNYFLRPGTLLQCVSKAFYEEYTPCPYIRGLLLDKEKEV